MLAAALFLNGHVNRFTRNLSFGLFLAVKNAFFGVEAEELLRSEEQKDSAFLQGTLEGKYENRP
jgi:hypothetical protein